MDRHASQAGTDILVSGWKFLVLVLAVSLLTSCGSNGGGVGGTDAFDPVADDMSCNLIHDMKCGLNSAGKDVVLECLPVLVGDNEFSAVKEWQIQQICGGCCLAGECVMGSQCVSPGMQPDTVSAEDTVQPADSIRPDTGNPEDSWTTTDTRWPEDMLVPSEDTTPAWDIQEDEGCYYCYDAIYPDTQWWVDTPLPWDTIGEDSANITCPEDKCHPSNPCNWDCTAFCDCPGAAWDFNDCNGTDCHDPNCCKESNPCGWDNDQQCECGGAFAWDAADCAD